MEDQEFHTPEGFQSICTAALKTATGKMIMPAGEQKEKTATSAHRILVRVGLLGPALGGHCVLDMSLLTALNLSAMGICGKNFTSINDESPENEDTRKRVLGVPCKASAQHYKCLDQWVKTITVDLGPVHNDEKMNVAVNKPTAQFPNGTIRIKIGDGNHQTYKLDDNKQAIVDLKERKSVITVIDLENIIVDFDETHVTLGPVPSMMNENHIVTQIDGKKYLVKGPSALVKSRLLELANQVSPYVIPEELTGDISTPTIIPQRLKHLPLPDLKSYETFLIIMGVGELVISAELRDITGLSERQLNILKGLFNFTFYHPELKKIFG